MSNQKKYITTKELADMLGISRIAVYKRIKRGDIKAHLRGNRYVIDINDVPFAIPGILTTHSKQLVETSVARTIQEYGDVLKKLGQE